VPSRISGLWAGVMGVWALIRQLLFPTLFPTPNTDCPLGFLIESVMERSTKDAFDFQIQPRMSEVWFEVVNAEIQGN
jgi:hypothetical protein